MISSTNKTIKDVQDELRKMPLLIKQSLCLTGSSMLVGERDFTNWESDVDLFAYNPSAFVTATTYFYFTKRGIS